MKTLDLVTYPIGEGVIYEMIHQRHRHKRDNLRVKNKSENDIKKEIGQKHQNSRRSEVNINVKFTNHPNHHYLFTSFKIEKRLKIVNNLRNLNNPLIQKFSNKELQPLITENGYHSPKISESDNR
jgi:hypothetical protein